MSYVLDALRRAEADRQRGQVPDLHALADGVPPPTRPLAGTGRVRSLPAVAAVGSSVALLVVMLAAMLAVVLLAGQYVVRIRAPVMSAETVPGGTTPPSDQDQIPANFNDDSTLFIEVSRFGGNRFDFSIR